LYLQALCKVVAELAAILGVRALVMWAGHMWEMAAVMVEDHNLVTHVKLSLERAAVGLAGIAATAAAAATAGLAARVEPEPAVAAAAAAVVVGLPVRDVLVAVVVAE
tara:strand:- start:963 stop:1283 length:321 start_codon:yes stop_codon:yes gene_type:complete